MVGSGIVNTLSPYQPEHETSNETLTLTRCVAQPVMHISRPQGRVRDRYPPSTSLPSLTYLMNFRPQSDTAPMF